MNLHLHLSAHYTYTYTYLHTIPIPTPKSPIVPLIQSVKMPPLNTSLEASSICISMNSCAQLQEGSYVASPLNELLRLFLSDSVANPSNFQGPSTVVARHSSLPAFVSDSLSSPPEAGLPMSWIALSQLFSVRTSMVLSGCFVV